MITAKESQIYIFSFPFQNIAFMIAFIDRYDFLHYLSSVPS